MKRILIAAALLSLLLVGPALATIGLDDVIRMLEADVSEEVILKAIDADNARFVITSDDLIDLEDAGASDWFLEALIDRSEPAPSYSENSYRVIEPYSGYLSIGFVYDPFDYYFVTWPYYYAWVSPWGFYRPYWYYAGFYHRDWCDPGFHRAQYYNRHWGPRSVWDRGFRHARYHVPVYRSSEKERAANIYERYGRSNRTNDGRRQVWGRPAAKDAPRAVEAPRRTGDDRSARWGRPARPDRASSPSRPPRTEVRRTPPARNSSPSRGASAPGVRAPARPAPAPRASTSRDVGSRSGSGERPARESGGRR